MPRAVEVRQVRPVPLFDLLPVPPIAHTWIKAIAAMLSSSCRHALSAVPTAVKQPGLPHASGSPTWFSDLHDRGSETRA